MLEDSAKSLPWLRCCLAGESAERWMKASLLGAISKSSVSQDDEVQDPIHLLRLISSCPAHVYPCLPNVLANSRRILPAGRNTIVAAE